MKWAQGNILQLNLRNETDMLPNVMKYEDTLDFADNFCLNIYFSYFTT